ncbi:hypothetical protein [Roseateles depolymerans]|uniref:Uncharacterized protein n=1 Tax=Roseateles depolymerans TaxID=76731 RepID=A0A0U2U395_9BURK|nr:hypothetical protein [Roseateles depolymerans]ALV06705.1 hypothetical protein RD2015_2233 [Roseateles depolymerans]REG19682.1 hypothetical protein DES44_2182 [Roseateles depolymerans]
MPRTSFAGTAFGAANQGLGRLASSLLGGDQAYQQGYDQELGLQSNIAKSLAQIGAANAMARENNAKADQQAAETALLKGRPDQYESLVASAAGADLPTVQAVRKAIQTGQPAQIDGVGPMPDGSALQVGVEPAVSGRIAQQLQRLAPVLLNSKDFKIDDWANAQGQYRNMDLGDQVLNGQRSASDVGRAQAAVAAKPLYNSDASGAVLDLFGGGLDTSNPMAQAAIALRGAQAGAQRANAVQSYASAENSRANAEKLRTEMRDGLNRAGAKAPTGYRWMADGSGLEPIPGGPADPNTKGAKQTKPPTEGQAKALLFGSRMQIADDIINELASQGVNENSRTKRALESVPVVGGALGTLANFSQTPQQQQVEQAQRDFINAVLRRESGAAIAESEFANAKRQYFPQPGDTPQVLRQKAANRRAAIQGFKAEIGDSLSPDFERIVGEAKAGRMPPDAVPVNTGSTSGGWGDAAPADASGWSIKRIN